MHKVRTRKAPDSELSISQSSLVRRIQEASDDVRIAYSVAMERAREAALKEVADKKALRDMLIRQAYSDGLDGGWRKGKGLSAATIKRAYGNSDHRSLMDIINTSALAPLRRGSDFTLTDRKDAGGWRIVLVHWYELPTGEVVEHPAGGSEWTVETFSDQMDSRKKYTALVEPEDKTKHDEFTKRAMNWLSKNPQSFRDWQADITTRILAEIDKEGY